MNDVYLFVYIISLTLLILHEIESAYWKEWELFGINGGITFFIIIHFLPLIIALYGIIEVYKGTIFGSIAALIVSIIGITAFFIHLYFGRKDNTRFNIMLSKVLLWLILLVSTVLLVMTGEKNI